MHANRCTLQFSLHDSKISKGSILFFKHKNQILLSSEIRLIPLSLFKCREWFVIMFLRQTWAKI